jgi:hypothetical protein
MNIGSAILIIGLGFILVGCTQEYPIITKISSPIINGIHPHSIEDISTIMHGIIETNITLDQDMFVKSVQFETNGITKESIHHAVVLDRSKLGPDCTVQPYQTIFSIDMAPMQFDGEYGVAIHNGTTLTLSVMFKNPNPPFGKGANIENAQVSVILKGYPLNSTQIHLKPLFLSAASCERHYYMYSIAPNTSFHQTNDSYLDSEAFTFPKNSTIVYSFGHLHANEGGKQVIMLRNDRAIHEFIPIKISEYSWETPISHELFAFESGDTIRPLGLYSNPTNFTIPDAMAIIGAYYIER